MLTTIGTIDSFDADEGLGLVVDSAGRRYRFHCTVITDGSRTIEPGRTVAFKIGPGGPGAWEATVIIPIDVNADPGP